MSASTIERLAALVERGGEPDDVLRATVAALADEPGIAWAGIALVEDGELVLGPAAGEPDQARRVRVGIEYGEELVGELWVDGEAALRETLERVAELVSPYVLIGWDTGGEVWEP